MLVTMRVPSAEQITAPTEEHPMRLAKAFILLREEHDPELANEHIEAGIREWRRRTDTRSFRPSGISRVDLKH
jgi:hypothetical protein